jgi:hypothetical protein
MWALLVLDVLGFGGLIFWLKQRIGTLEGALHDQGVTIAAQKVHLEAADQTNRRLREFMETLDLEQWVKRFDSHRRLVEAEGEAKLEAGRRELQKQLELTQRQGQQTSEALEFVSMGYLVLATKALVHVPRAEREAIIDGTEIPAYQKQIFKDWAARAPEQVERGSGLAALAKFVLESSPDDEGKGIFDVKPPPERP